MIKPIEIPQPDKWDTCQNDMHWDDLIVFGGCRICNPDLYKNFLNSQVKSNNKKTNDKRIINF